MFYRRRPRYYLSTRSRSLSARRLAACAPGEGRSEASRGAGRGYALDAGTGLSMAGEPQIPFMSLSMPTGGCLTDSARKRLDPVWHADGTVCQKQVSI